jgi:hypothetical protein
MSIVFYPSFSRSKFHPPIKEWVDPLLIYFLFLKMWNQNTFGKASVWEIPFYWIFFIFIVNFRKDIFKIKLCLNIERHGTWLCKYWNKRKNEILYGREWNKNGERIIATKNLKQLRIKWKLRRSSETVQSNRTIMAVGRERCNLNKSYTVSCIQNNRQKHSNQAICVRATVQLFWQKIQYFHRIC